MGETSSATSGGGASFVPPPPPPAKGALVDGRLVAPASAPLRVKRTIAFAEPIVEKPYVYGGGHKPFERGVLDAATTAREPSLHALRGGRFLAPLCRAAR